MLISLPRDIISTEKKEGEEMEEEENGGGEVRRATKEKSWSERQGVKLYRANFFSNYNHVQYIIIIMWDKEPNESARKPSCLPCWS